MSKSLMGLLVGLLSCASVSAGSFAVTGHVGIATGGEDVASLNEQLQESGFSATASTSGDIRTSWKASVGYTFDSNWGVNLAYVDLGEATVGFEGIDVPIDELLAGIGDIHPRSAHGTKLMVAYQHPLNKTMHVQGMVGVFDWDASYTLNGETSGGILIEREVEQVGTDVTTSLGLVHKLTNNMSWHLDWDFYEIDSEPVNIFSFGLAYKVKLF